MSNDYVPVKPLDGMTDLDRATVAKYFNRVGRGLNCRIDVPVLTIEDVKWSAKVFGDLARELTDIAFNDKRTDIWRVLEARYAMEAAKRELHYRNNRKETKKISRKQRNNPYHNI
jgi:hypothetical protein